MKNFMRTMALVLCLVMLFPAALAQETAYRIGEPARAAFADAFMAGKLVTAQIELDIDLNEQITDVSQEELAQIAAVLDVVSQSKLTVGAGKIDGGVRLALEAEVADAAGANPVSVSALADLTLDGVSVESDVIPGKRVSAKWETILALCGVGEVESAMILSLRDIDPAMIEQAIAQIPAALGMAAQMATPYLETVLGFVQTLPIEVREDLNEEGYPPTATELHTVVTMQDVSTLITLLLDQLEQDTVMLAVLDSLITEAELGYETAELLAMAREAADEMNSVYLPVALYLGMDENGTPLYGEIFFDVESLDGTIYAGLFLYQNEHGAWVAEAIGGIYDAEENPLMTAYLGGVYAADVADPNVFAYAGDMYIYEGETPLLDMVFESGVTKAEDSELAAYESVSVLSMYTVENGVDVQMVYSGSGRQELTANGGEKATSSLLVDTYVGDMTVSQTQTLEELVEPTADGGVSGYAYVTETMPASGIDKLDMKVIYASEDIDMAASEALAHIELETVSEDAMNALMEEAYTLLGSEKLPALIENLPPEALEMILADSALTAQ